MTAASLDEQDAVAQAPQREPWPSPEMVAEASAGFADHDDPSGDGLENVGRQIVREVQSEKEDEAHSTEHAAHHGLWMPRATAEEATPAGKADLDHVGNALNRLPIQSPARTPRKARKGRGK